MAFLICKSFYNKKRPYKSKKKEERLGNYQDALLFVNSIEKPQSMKTKSFAEKSNISDTEPYRTISSIPFCKRKEVVYFRLVAK